MHETARLLRDLVALPSVNPMGRSLPKELTFEHRVTDYLQQGFQDLGLGVERRRVVPWRHKIIAHYPGIPLNPGIHVEVVHDTESTDKITVPHVEGRIDDG